MLGDGACGLHEFEISADGPEPIRFLYWEGVFPMLNLQVELVPIQGPEASLNNGKRDES
jgi:hypothetical protein